MYKWELIDEKLERAELATENRANELVEMLEKYANSIMDATVYGEYNKLRDIVEDFLEEADYYAEALIEDDDVRRSALKEQEELTEDEEWEEVEG